MRVVKVIRLAGGVVLGVLAAGFILLGIGAFASGFGAGSGILYPFAVVVCIGIGIMFAQLAACCFSPKYKQAVAERDYRNIVRS